MYRAFLQLAVHNDHHFCQDLLYSVLGALQHPPRQPAGKQKAQPQQQHTHLHPTTLGTTTAASPVSAPDLPCRVLLLDGLVHLADAHVGVGVFDRLDARLELLKLRNLRTQAQIAFRWAPPSRAAEPPPRFAPLIFVSPLSPSRESVPSAREKKKYLS